MKRLQIAKSWDFNQMLVASVSGHLLLMTFVLFLPKTTTLDKIIPPAFMVELVEISTGEKKSAQKPSQKQRPPVPVEIVKPVVPPKLIEPIQQVVKLSEPKTSKTSDQIINRLDQLKKTPSKLDKSFDQLARQLPIVPPKPPEVKESKPIQEKTFNEVHPMDNPLDQFESLDLKETLDEEPPPPEEEVVKKTDSRFKELEFASLSKYTDEPGEKQDEKSSADLLKELTEMKQLDIADEKPTVVQNQEVEAPSIAQDKSKVFDSILKKLDSLESKPKNINTEVVIPETITQNFQSDIRKVSVPKQVQVDLVISPNQAYVQSSTPGEPGADALALYKGMIIKKVMENWNAPLGQDHNKKVIISFNIFPQGNIDRPDLQKSSRVDLLDNLALRAIRESEPFPKFPESLKSSNLNISIHFKYIPEKTKHDS